MSNIVHQNGRSFEEVCEQAKAKSLTPDYQGCAVHVNAHVIKGLLDPNGSREFIVIFGLSDWFSEESTQATFVNGQDRT